ncbi:hypothetical protein JYB87_12710 [Shewanella avicenniae]|uniref:Uncharacterized protein n=1 Tax=Shewanella avicenniae TaxID=2814294 RepID=A0ABX7QP00_9GAMM|nr:hypothetical protein [Shewanella avicenniae]QSX32610.1 hypothetical protein JYB87_12710 [Shewanella avicenniae]
MAVKPLNSSQKALLRNLALAMAVATLEKDVLKPSIEAEGKTFKDGEFRRRYFKNMPQVAQAERALGKALRQAYTELAAAMKADNGGQNGE